MKALVLSLLFFCFTNQFLAENSPIYKSVNLGLVLNQINCLSQDNSGKLLLGTENGLYVYNGQKTIPFPFTGLENKAIKTIIRNQNKLFIATNTGEVWTFHNKKLVQLKKSNPDFLAIKEVNETVVVLYTTTLAIYDVKTGKFSAEETIPFAEKTNPAVDVAAFNSNYYILLNSNELIDFTNKESRTIPFSVKFLAESSDGLLLFPEFINLSGFAIYKDGVFASKTMKMPKQLKRIDKIERIKGTLFAYSKMGLFKLHTKTKTALRWFESENIQTIYIDSKQNKWMISQANQLLVVTKTKLKKYNSSSYLKSISLDQTTVLLMNENHIRQLNTATGKITPKLTRNFKGQTFKRISRSNYILLDDGIFNWKTSVFYPWTKSSFKAIGIVENKWILSDQFGIKEIEIEEFNEKIEKEIQKKEYLSTDLQFQEIETVNEHFYAVNDGKLLSFTKNKWEEIQNFGKSLDVQFLLTNGVELLVVSTLNKLYTIKDLEVIKERNLTLDGKMIFVINSNYSHFGLVLQTQNSLIRLKNKSDSFEKIETNGIIPLGFHDLGHSILSITKDGMYTYNWKIEKTVFGSFEIGRPYLINKEGNKEFQFSQLNGSIIIPVDYLDLIGHEDHVYRYRIRSQDANGMWNLITTSISELRFDYLSAGKYTLEIQLFDRVSGESSQSKEIKFSVSGPWLKLRDALWFFFGMALTIFTIRIMKARRRRNA
ncbi:MAG: hypothetical protein ACK46Y_12600 [Fluviicola sp.]